MHSHSVYRAWGLAVFALLSIQVSVVAQEKSPLTLAAEFEALGVSWRRYMTPHATPGDGTAHDQSGLMMSPSLMPGTFPSY